MSRRPFSGLTAGPAALLALSLALPAQITPPAPVERHDVTVRLVLVDVIAFDRDGRFVEDLSPSDFELKEDGRPMDLASAELVRLRRGGGASEPAPADAPFRDSPFVVVFDSVNTVKRVLDRNKPEILAKLVQLLEIGRDIIVFELKEDGRMEVLQPLTRDRALVAKAVEKATGSVWVDKAGDSLIVPSVFDGNTPIRVDGIGTVGFQQSTQMAFEAETRRRFEKTVNGLLGVMNIVKDFRGRKSLLFVSGGIPSLSFVRFFEGGGTADTTAVQSQVAAAKVDDPFKLLGKKTFRTGSEIFDDLVRFANSHNITFYALDPDNYLRYVLGDIAYDNFPRAIGRSASAAAGLNRPDEIAEIKRSELASLRTLSDDTGGAAFLGGSKFEHFAGIIERDFAQYYELSYAPKGKKADGKYHRIQVKVLRPGLDIRFREGYLDYSEEQREGMAFASAAYNPGLFRDIPFQARLVPFATGRDKYVLWIQTALSARKVLGEGAEADRAVLLKFQLTLDDPSGASGFRSETAVPIALLPSLLRRVRNAEYFGWSCASGETEIKPRTYRATFAVYDRALDRMGAVESSVEVPEVGGGGEPKVLSTSVGMLVKSDKAAARPFAVASDDGTVEVPGRKFFPMAVAHVQRGQRAGLLVQIGSSQDPRKWPLAVTASRVGGSAGPAALGAAVVHEQWSKKTGIWNALYELELETLAPGDYAIVLSWAAAAGGEPLETVLAFRVL